MNAPRLLVLAIAGILLAAAAGAAELPLVPGVELQPLAAQAKRVATALELLGSPLSGEQQAALEKAAANTSPAEAVEQIQTSARSALPGRREHQSGEPREGGRRSARRSDSMQHGWRVFLVKVHNEAGVTAELRCTSPNAAPLHRRSDCQPDPQAADHAAGRRQPLAGRQPVRQAAAQQSALRPGAGVPHRGALQPRRRQARGEAGLRRRPGDAGPRLPQRAERPVRLRAGGRGGARTSSTTTARRRPGSSSSATRRAASIPRGARRLAPDFFFHDQIYRHSGETVLLPPGKYTVTYTRGPEYRILTREIDRAAGRLAQGIVPAEALDQAGRPRLVLGRSSRPRRRLRPLRLADAKACSRTT